ncbi:MAG: Pr2TM family membrane protein [Oscillatoriales cyanobacterium RM2_1_1]|nr:Pr2TM family membrane protein [Oscillatoriales cyanobacterium SM2_3_0]NJO46369.1 Pr2TM family membrane protein [Oscillatoriales cyanobacterium RM2_1_1]
MPPRWPRKPDRQDPDYRKLDDRMTFAVHVAAFAAVNSGLWFLRQIEVISWSGVPWITGIWVGMLLGHGIYIFAIADYSSPTPNQPS